MHNKDALVPASYIDRYDTANTAHRWQTAIPSTIHNIYHAMERDEETGDNRSPKNDGPCLVTRGVSPLYRLFK